MSDSETVTVMHYNKGKEGCRDGYQIEHNTITRHVSLSEEQPLIFIYEISLQI